MKKQSQINDIKDLQKLMKTIDYQFKNELLLKQALTHVSAVDEHNKSNERLEFLGDAVLELIVSQELYRRHRKASEGEMTRLRASIVCENGLFLAAKKIQLGDYLYLGAGERKTGGNDKPSILSDAFEALLAAVYIDGGFGNAQRVALSVLEDHIKSFEIPEETFDYKTALQEYLQQEGNVSIQYQIVDTKGPDHERMFEACVFVMDKPCGKGWGKSKKTAEQEAARQYLMVLGQI